MGNICEALNFEFCQPRNDDDDDDFLQMRKLLLFKFIFLKFKQARCGTDGTESKAKAKIIRDKLNLPIHSFKFLRYDHNFLIIFISTPLCLQFAYCFLPFAPLRSALPRLTLLKS